MNLSVRGFGMFGSAISGFAPGGKLPGMRDMTLKSTQEAAQRAQKAAGQIGYWEQRKAGLKNMECGSLEEIAGKLDMLHTYEDEIAAAKAAYNQEQMFHLLDEARERGEKIAEAVEKMEPKTPEERQEELAEEALGVEEDGGMLKEILEESEEIMEELEEEVLEETTEELTQEAVQRPGEELMQEIARKSDEELTQEAAQRPEEGISETALEKAMAERDGKIGYRPFDVRA